MYVFIYFLTGLVQRSEDTPGKNSPHLNTETTVHLKTFLFLKTEMMLHAGCFVELMSAYSPWLPLHKQQQQLELKRGRGL